MTSYITAATAIAASKGIRLLVGTDFFEFQRYLALQPESPAISAMFSATPGKVAPKDGFWIIGLDDRGDVVHSQAMRLLDLSDKVLAEHLGSHYLSYIPGAETIDPALASYTPSLGPRSISGRVVCHGHLWLKGGADGYRGSGLIAVLPRLAMAVALRRWSPDYLFGFIYPLAACKGLAAREGYMHLEPGNLRWTMPAREDPIDGWLVWMSQADITYLLSLGLSDIFEKLESTKRG